MVPNKYVVGGARVLIVVLGLMFIVVAGNGAYSAVDVGLVLVTQERYKNDGDPAFTKVRTSFQATIRPGDKIYTPLDTDGTWRQHLVEISVLQHTYLVSDPADADWIVGVVLSTNAAGRVDARLEIRPAP